MHKPQRALVTPARPPLIDGLMTREEACRVILLDCLTHSAANIAPVKDRNREGLHQLRVALRRLRVALVIFADVLPASSDLERQAKALSRAVAGARDADVFLDELLTPAIARMEPLPAFEILRQRAETARMRAWDEAVKEITSPALPRFQSELAAAAEKLEWPVQDAIPLRVLVPVVMNGYQKKCARRGRHLKTMKPNEWHRLRVALKHLRYAGEFFAPVYKRKAVKAWLDPLKELLDLLGHLNDVAQVRTTLGRLLKDAPRQAELSHAAGLIQGWHQARADRSAKKTVKRWERFQDAEAFWID